jgi:hypothetical protein
MSRTTRSQRMGPPQPKRQYSCPLMDALRELLLSGDVLQALSYRNVDSPKWTGWGTIANRKLTVGDSFLAEDAGRGLFAGQPFRKHDLITIYGGELIHKSEAKSRDPTFILHIKDSDWVVDGAAVAMGFERVAPRWDEPHQPKQHADVSNAGLGALGNQGGKRKEDNNAKFEYVPLSNDKSLSHLPRVPVIVATRDIEEGEEIMYPYGSDAPFHGELRAPVNLEAVARYTLAQAAQYSRRPSTAPSSEAPPVKRLRSVSGTATASCSARSPTTSAAPTVASSSSGDNFGLSDAAVEAIHEAAAEIDAAFDLVKWTEPGLSRGPSKDEPVSYRSLKGKATSSASCSAAVNPAAAGNPSASTTAAVDESKTPEDPAIMSLLAGFRRL